VRVVVVAVVLSCVAIGPAVAHERPLVFGFGCGLDLSGYSSVGRLLDVGPALGGFVTWMGSYPRVYRLSAQWTHLHHDEGDFCLHADLSGGASTCGPEALTFTALQGGVMWFDGDAGATARYAGASVGAFRTRSERTDVSPQWHFVVSPTFGIRLDYGPIAMSLESGAEVVIDGDDTFVVVPVRLYFDI